LLDGGDDERSRPVVLIDELLARRAWAGRSAIGQEIRVNAWRDGEGFVDSWAEVVGVVAHIRQHDPARAVREEVFLPYYQFARNQLAVALRSTTDPTTLTTSVRAEVARIDPDLAITNLTALDAAVERATAAPRFAATVVGGFAVFALLLAALGIHGVVSYAVAQRVPEIGLRRALGATGADVVRLVAGQGAATIAAGVAVGLLAAVASSSAIQSLLFGVRAHDPAAPIMATMAIVGAALAAMVLPACRALRVDPLRALREE
jgi:ABC-type antimicrobial peptide transport system permease subunit